MNRIYMTFPTEDEVKFFPWLKDANSSALVRELLKDLYYESETLIVNKNDTLNIKNKRLGIIVRPVINSNESLVPFIEKNRINKGGYDSILLGTFPLKVANNIDRGTLTETNKKRTIPINYSMVTLNEYTDGNRNFVIVGDDIIEILPIEWEYDESINKLFCKTSIFKCNTSKTNDLLMAYNYMNNQLFMEMLDDYTVIKDNSDIKLIDDKGYISFDYPYSSFIEFDDLGNIIFHGNEYNLTIPNTVRKIDEYAFDKILGNDSSKLSLNIDIDGDDLSIPPYAFNLNTIRANVHIVYLNVHNELSAIGQASFNTNFPIDNITILCDFALFSRLYLSGDNFAKNLFENSKFTLTYTSENELVKFVSDINRFFELIYKSLQKEKNKRFYSNDVTSIDFSYKFNTYKYIDASTCIPNIELLKNKEILSILKVSSFTLKGPTISDELISKLFPNFSVKKEFTDLVQKEKTATKQIDEPKNKEEKAKLSKEVEHILDLAREIISIEYIGLDKETVRKKVDEIVIEYNNGLSKKSGGLSLTTNNGVYTNTIIKLENLRDALYHNFEKNLGFYDILDLISSMIKKLNDEEVKIDYEILKDLDTLTKILKYSKDEQTKNELISYLENESKRIVDYLSGKIEIDYKNIDEFVKKFRLFLVPILTRVSGNVSKVDVMEQIKDYALDAMNDKTTENTNNYIKLILSEIDKIKKNILELDSEYAFEDFDYSSFKTGKEILDYLDKKYMEYYRVYLDLVENKVNEENYENSKVPLIY